MTRCEHKSKDRSTAKRRIIYCRAYGSVIRCSRNFSILSNNTSNRSLVGIDGGRTGFDTKSTNEAFASAFRLLVAGEPLRRRPDSEDTIDALPSPTMAVVDVSTTKLCKAGLLMSIVFLASRI